jgi:protoheme IX farnesyltransferase
MNTASRQSYELTPSTAVFSGTRPRASVANYLELTKPRLSLLSVLTTLVGYLAVRPPGPGWKLVPLLAGTAACAGGVAALNQWLEADTDARMSRTRDRPIPSGRVSTGSAFVLGWGLCAGGLATLFAEVNGVSAAFALATVTCYLAVYTPAKRWSRWSTEIGAVAGALPPLIGWTAAAGRVSALGGILFAVLFFWQIPHFMAISWIYRRDYAAVNFPMLPVRDAGGGKVAAWSLISTAGLVGLTLLPVGLGFAHPPYGLAAGGLGGWLLWRAAAFLQPTGREVTARRLFFASIIYLPLLLGALVVDRMVF